MTWNILSHTSAQSNVTVTTPAIDTTKADLIVLGLSVFNGGDPNPPTLTDSAGNTFGPAIVTNGVAGRQNGYIYFLEAPITSTTHTFGTSTAINGSIAVLAASGSISNPLDQTNSTTYNIAGTTQESPGSILPIQNNELCVVVYCIDDPSGSTFSIDSGYTIQEAKDVVPGAMFGIVLATNIQTTAISTNPILSRSALLAARGDVALIASFQGVQPPPPPTGPTTGGRQVDEDELMIASHKWHKRQLEAEYSNISAIAAELGRRGGLVRAQNLTAKQRTDIATKAAQARWK